MHSLEQAVSINKEKTSAVSTTDWMVATQLCKLRGTLDLCFIYDMVFVKCTWLLIHCFAIFAGGRSRVFSSLGTATLDVFSRAVYEAAGLVDVCM